MVITSGKTKHAEQFDRDSVARTLSRQGYSYQETKDRIVVQDPVQSSHHGIIYQAVLLSTNTAAARFFNERS